MIPVIIDKETGAELWRSKECADYIGVTLGTWSNYYANRRTPEPVGMLDKRSPLWDAETVKDWHANRPGAGSTDRAQ